MTPLGNRYDSSHSAAVESAVNAYATKLLRMKSPPEACIDDSLGPYVTSMLRCCNQIDDVKDLEEFESLMELLEEHCALSTNDASSALSTIANAVRTGNVPVDPLRRVSLEDLGVGFDDPLSFNSEYNANYSNPQASDNHVVEVETSSPFPEISGNPLRSPDKFIPVDLMGVLDNPATPVPKKSESTNKEPEPEAFPPLGTSAPPPSGNIPKKTGKPPRKPSKEAGKDLAAAFFRPTSRSRQQSIDENDSYSSTSPKQASLGDIGYQTFPISDEQQNYYHQQQLDSAVEMLLAVNPDLSEGAARASSILGIADVNVAQYVIDQAMAAPPVCRHMLNDGCYRSDCQFSHDVDGHTCLFWLRGRCGKGDSCRFRHGFSPKLLDGIKMSQPPPLEVSNEQAFHHSGSNPVPIATKNLLSHNKEIGTPLTNSWSAGSGFSSMRGYYMQSQGHHSASSGWDDFPTASTSLDSKSNNSFSFATIATKGYKNSDSFTATTGPLPSSSQKAKSVKIPQDMWNAHINRDAAAFHIQDPLERYMEVSKAVARADTIDLHFQSTSSFPTVLAKILPMKLRDHDQVWVVTGSGHHVARDSHQKGGGVLETAVLNWLDAEGYYYHRGRDRNGHSGAVLVRCSR